jgi:hypothetical protein
MPKTNMSPLSEREQMVAVLLSECGTPQRAARYAQYHARQFELCGNNPKAAREYAQGARDLRALIPLYELRDWIARHGHEAWIENETVFFCIEAFHRKGFESITEGVTTFEEASAILEEYGDVNAIPPRSIITEESSMPLEDSSTPDPRSVAQKIAAELREYPARWTQDVFARNSRGDSVAHDSPEAVCWCLHGLIRRALGLPSGRLRTVGAEIISAFDRAAAVANPSDREFRGFVAWQDQECRTVGEIIAVCDWVAAP